MSSGFRVGGEVFWGTNGAVELYVETIARLASERFGIESPIAQFFSQLQKGFPLMGTVIPLEDVLGDRVAPRDLIQLFDEASKALLGSEAFSEYGKQWVETVVTALSVRLNELANSAD
jgi:hypothetical protein